MKIYLIFLAAILISCGNSKNPVIITKEKSADSISKIDTTTKKENITKVDKAIDFSVNPVAIIYKTKKDYNNKVPVTLNDEKTKIVSYPAIKDVYYNGKLALPDKLNDGFLLDNRGISKNVAFLNITYEEYSKRTEVYSLAEMMNLIIDKDPLTVMYNCGSRYQYTDIVKDLNKYIDTKQLSKFKKVL